MRFFNSVLATHSLTGKPSPAFQFKSAKKKLNAQIVDDIVHTVASLSSKEVDDQMKKSRE